MMNRLADCASTRAATAPLTLVGVTMRNSTGTLDRLPSAVSLFLNGGPKYVNRMDTLTLLLKLICVL